MIIKPAVRQPPSVLADLSVVTLLAAVLYGVVRIARHWHEPIQPVVEIDLSLWALPGYALLSLLRSFAAYLLSMLFALGYGYAAAHDRRAERVLMPLLDILQSIPVLGFLPGAVLVLVTLFPRSNTGLELASILLIATSQCWNLAFSFYSSLRRIPPELREAADVYQFSWWQRFRQVELPASAVGLAWNSMMSMAGGWFFLTVCEAFTLGTHDFRLPGLGAYMSEALRHSNGPAIAGGILAMMLVILVVDVCLWRPVLVWCRKFRIEETAALELQGSVVLDWLSRSWLLQLALPSMVHPIKEWLAKPLLAAGKTPPPRRAESPDPSRARQALGLLAGALAIGGLAWSAGRLLRLLLELPPADWAHLLVGAVLTCARVGAAVALGSLWAVPVGIWIGRSAQLRSRLQPLVQIAASFPAPMIYPLVLLALHRMGWTLGVGSVILMMLGTQWYILFNVIAGASAVPEDLRQAADAYQFTSRQRWRILWWPAVFPYLVTGWVTAAGGAWNASIVAEYVVQGRDVVTAWGLGSLISVAASSGRYALLAAGVLVMSGIVLVVNRLCWKPLYHLAQTRYAG